MRLLYLVDWLPPDFGAIGQYAAIEARQLAECGDQVVLVGLTSGASDVSKQTIGRGSLTTVLLHSPPIPKGQLKARAVWTLRTNLRLAAQALRHIGDIDQILFTGSPPFLEYALVPLRKLLGASLTFRIADFHPECTIEELGDRTPGWLTAMLAVTVRLRRAIERFEVLGEDSKRLLIQQGISPERIEIVRSESPVVFSENTPRYAIPTELRGKKLLLYSGTVGFAHDCDTFIQGYEAYHRGTAPDDAAQNDGDKFMLWLNANGVRADGFEQELRRRGLPVYRTKGVDLDALPSLLVSVDAHLITLKNEFVGLCVPSKMYACIDSGKPVLYVGSTDGDVHLMCSTRAAGRYFRADIGDAAAVTRALQKLHDAPSERPRQRAPSSEAGAA